MTSSDNSLNLSDIQQKIEDLREIEELIPRRQDIIDLRDDLNAIRIPDQIAAGDGVEKLREAIMRGEEKVRFYFGPIMGAKPQSGGKRKRKQGLTKHIKALLLGAPMKTMSRADLMEKLVDEGFQSNSINSSLHSFSKSGVLSHDKVKKEYSLK